MILTPREKNLIMIDDIAFKYKCSREDILGHRKFKMFLRPRYECIKMLRNKGHTTTEIGRIMNRDHSTIVHALQNMAKQEALGG